MIIQRIFIFNSHFYYLKYMQWSSDMFLRIFSIEIISKNSVKAEILKKLSFIRLSERLW